MSSSSAIASAYRHSPSLNRLINFQAISFNQQRLYHIELHPAAPHNKIELSCHHRSKSGALERNFLFSTMKAFWGGSVIKDNEDMVEKLKNQGLIESQKVVEVMKAVDRALFVRDRSVAYIDSPMSIDYNATISAPHMHASCLQILVNHLQPGMHALDVGSGTGYLAACFAMMVGKEGRAVGVEHIPELVEWSKKNVEGSAAAWLMKEGSLSLHTGDGRKGWPEFAPYDVIRVGAAAEDIPPELLNQLKPGGRMVIPVGEFFQDLKVVDKNEDGSISVRSEISVRYVPLTSKESQLRGY